MPHCLKIVSILSALLISLSACSKKSSPPPPRPPAPVVTARATQQDVPVMLRAIGNVEASEIVSIKTQISGELVHVAFKEGDEVRKGALLFKLDARPYLAALKKAESALARDRVIMENARTNYERYRQLVKEGIVTAEQAETLRTAAESAEATVAADRAEVDNCRALLTYCTITAPTSGKLGVLAIHQGNVVKANDLALVTINKINPVKVLFSVPEKELAEVKKQLGMGRLPVAAEVPGVDGSTEKGTVNFVDNTVDSTTGTIRLKGTFENRLKRLWPGQLVNVSITMGLRKNAVVVPSQAIQTGQQGQYLFVVKEDLSAELRPVTTGPVSGGMTVIESGLKPAEQIVIDGQVRIIPGSKVVIKPGPGTREPGTASKHESRVTGSGFRTI